LEDRLDFTPFHLSIADLSVKSNSYLITFKDADPEGRHLKCKKVYNYTSANLVGTPIANATSGTFVRSYNILTIHRTTGVTVATRYDVFGTAGQGLVLANYLDSLSNDVIVIIATFDEPRNATPFTYAPASMVAAIERCGGEDPVSVLNVPPGIINYRGSYILVGIPGIGLGNGLQRYVGNGTIAGDPDAWIDLRISVKDGEYTYISG